jgi:hypothetical protein
VGEKKESSPGVLGETEEMWKMVQRVRWLDLIGGDVQMSSRRRRGSQTDSTPKRSGTDELDSGDLTASCRGNGRVVRFIRTQRR